MINEGDELAELVRTMNEGNELAELIRMMNEGDELTKEEEKEDMRETILGIYRKYKYRYRHRHRSKYGYRYKYYGHYCYRNRYRCIVGTAAVADERKPLDDDTGMKGQVGDELAELFRIQVSKDDEQNDVSEENEDNSDEPRKVDSNGNLTVQT